MRSRVLVSDSSLVPALGAVALLACWIGPKPESGEAGKRPLLDG